jgi:lipopolysaccharide transport system ATP-binding protein
MSHGFGIRVEGLGKQYRISERSAARRWRRTRRRPIWALRDVGFEIPAGSTLGVIGRNGAGKTTLLKILSRVTPPSTGRAEIRGRVSSLLEVGTGFHPELTGRENVFLNGAILGMRRREVAQRFDEIVAFSEIEEFIDTPVKRYSSGMSLRLAFSVAAHLEPDVLLVDEVLAVGDAAFQAKCVGKMGDVTGEGRTVVLVSHNMPTIAALSDRCLRLDGGRVVDDGSAEDVVRRYLETSRPHEGGEVELAGRSIDDPLRAGDVGFSRVRLLGPDGEARGRFYELEPIVVEVELDVRRPVRQLEVRSYVTTVEGVRLYASIFPARELDLRPGRYVMSTALEPNHLAAGAFRVDLLVRTAQVQDDVADAIRFEVEHNPADERAWTPRKPQGLLRFDYEWTDPRPVRSQQLA